MNKLIKLFRWLDNHLIKILIVFFIFFIPLYPKLPLIDIEYTYIYIRAEDLFIALITIIFLIQLLRKKVVLNRRLLIPIILFWLAVFLSYLNGFYRIKTIPVAFIGFYHALRRIEYMIVFFIAAASIKSKKDFFSYIHLVLIVLLIASIYGLGQKFFGWPAVQTMNPEYARGYFLYLTPEARISSTFAGHYDFASYIVFLIPLTLAYLFFKQKLRYFLIFIFSLLALVFTASRISYIAYILSAFSFLIFLKKPKTLLVVVFFTIVFTLFSKNLTSRLTRTFQIKRILVNEKTGEVFIPQKITTKEIPAGSFYLPIKDQGKSANVDAYKESIIKEKEKELKKKGISLTEKEREKLIASLSAQLKPLNTILSDISFATRIQVEWPRAIAAFIKNPLFGQGPSTLTEATDNDYLRWLGEFGLLGTLTFLSIFFIIIKTVFFATKKFDRATNLLLWGFLFGFFALLVNASYIDVFEASKVAFTFWLISGFFVGLAEKKLT